MKRLFTATLLTVAAVPFLMAAPNAATKTQNSAAPASQSKTTTKKAHKKHKSQSNKTATGTSAKK